MTDDGTIDEEAADFIRRDLRASITIIAGNIQKLNPKNRHLDKWNGFKRKWGRYDENKS